MSFRLTYLLIFLLWLSSCTREVLNNHSVLTGKEAQLENLPTVEGQSIPPDNIKSIQLYRGDRKSTIPAIELGENEFITLRFDELGERGRMFRVRVQHRNADWSPSTLMEGFYLSGHHEDLIMGGQPGNVQGPEYTHYTYRFPNENIQIRISGNYLLEVLDYETSQKIFSIPFFVFENDGQLNINIEELYVREPRYFLHHQLFARFKYPSYVLSPLMDLRIFFVQNRFWGRVREVDVEDVAEMGVYRGYLSRPASFIGIYEFQTLDLDRYDRPGMEILEVRPETIPPQVRLFRDVVNLNSNPSSFRRSSIYGNPRDESNARYVDVRFELELPWENATDLPIYVYGPFNNWTMNDRNRMEYRESTDSYIGRAVIKEGEYDYKYALVENGRLDDLALDGSFASSTQEYTTLVYFRDPEWQADRLLQIGINRTQ
ncbi:MAG: type IX secretion system plug protein domain-containing protein [Balneolales bacterium]